MAAAAAAGCVSHQQNQSPSCSITTQEAQKRCQQVAAPACLPSRVVMSWVTLLMSLHLCFHQSPINCWLLRGGTAALFSATMSWAHVGPWQHGHHGSAQIQMVDIIWGEKGADGAASSLLSTALHQAHAGYVQRTGRCRVPSSAAERGGAWFCQRQEREAQMAADALISENDEARQNKKTLATGEQPNKIQSRGREKGSRRDGPSHGA